MNRIFAAHTSEYPITGSYINGAQQMNSQIASWIGGKVIDAYFNLSGNVTLFTDGNCMDLFLMEIIDMYLPKRGLLSIRCYTCYSKNIKMAPNTT